MSICSICSKVLDNPDDSLSGDCGGDCVACMADAGDPDALRVLREVIEFRVHALVDSLTETISQDDDAEIRQQLTESFRFWRQ